jgi:hypothetical protein
MEGVRNAMNGKKLKQESERLMPVSSHGSTIGSPQRRVESGYLLREIVQHLRAVLRQVCFCNP